MWGRPVDPRAGHPEEGRGAGERGAGRAAAGRGRPDRARRPHEVIAGKLDDHFPLVVFQTGSRHPEQHERQRGHLATAPSRSRAARWAARRRSTPTTTSTGARAATTPSRPPCTSRWCEELHRAAVSAASASPARAPWTPRRRSTPGWSRSGRTHLQDATPITLGQEIGGWVAQIDYASTEVRHAGEGLLRARHRRHGGRHRPQRPPAVRRPRGEVLRRPRPASPSARPRTSSPPCRAHDALVQTSAALRTLAGALMKMANDVRWLASRPAQRHRRDRDPRERTRQLDHARQGEPHPVRGADHGRHPGVRQRRRGRLRRLAGQLPAQRVQAGDGPRRAGDHPPDLRDACLAFNDNCAVGIEPNREKIEAQPRART